MNIPKRPSVHPVPGPRTVGQAWEFPILHVLDWPIPPSERCRYCGVIRQMKAERPSCSCCGGREFRPFPEAP